MRRWWREKWVIECGVVFEYVSDRGALARMQVIICARR